MAAWRVDRCCAHPGQVPELPGPDGEIPSRLHAQVISLQCQFFCWDMIISKVICVVSDGAHSPTQKCLPKFKRDSRSDVALTQVQERGQQASAEGPSVQGGAPGRGEEVGRHLYGGFAADETWTRRRVRETLKLSAIYSQTSNLPCKFSWQSCSFIVIIDWMDGWWRENMHSISVKQHHSCHTWMQISFSCTARSWRSWLCTRQC